MLISPHFNLNEFCDSQTATRMGLKVKADAATIANLTRLCTALLEPLREHFGAVMISSGYRPPWLNKKIGGAPTSQHCLGLAADLVAYRASPMEVCLFAQKMDLPFDQLIHEFGRWVHISVPAVGTQARRQVLSATSQAGSTVYRQGLEGAA